MKSIVCVPFFFLCCAATAFAENALTVDDFSADKLSATWSSSASPEYYRGGGGQKGLSLITDVQQGRAMRVEFAFGEAVASSPLFVSRNLETKPTFRMIKAVRFRLKVVGKVPDRFGFRLRTGPQQHRNWAIGDLVGGSIPVDRWLDVEVPTAFDSNVWADIDAKIYQLTFWLGGGNCRGAFLVDDIQFVLASPVEESPYTPKASVRPTNAAPKVLLLKLRAAGFYCLPEAFRAIAPDVQITACDYCGPQFEFFNFPKTREELLAYDTIVLLDIDPVVLTDEQIRWLTDTVHSGSRMVIFGGTTTLARSRMFQRPLRDLLPVTFESGSDLKTVNAPPAPAAPHPLNRGLCPAGLGRVGSMQSLKVRPGGVVSWTAAGEPLVVTGQAGKGAVTVVNAMIRPGIGQDDFFTDVLSDDLIRQLCRWSLNQLSDVGIETLSLPQDASTLQGYSLTVTCSKGTTIQVLVDGKAQSVQKHKSGSFKADLKFPTPVQVTCDHTVRIACLKDGKVVDWRAVTVTVQTTVQLSGYWKADPNAFAPGSPVDLSAATSSLDPSVKPPSAETITARVITAGYEWDIPRVDAKGNEAVFSGKVPNLASAPAKVVVRAGDRVILERECRIVDPFDRTDFFPIKSTIGLEYAGHVLDDVGIREVVDDLKAHGINTIRATNPNDGKGPKQQRENWYKHLAAGYAQQIGMVLFYEYTNFTTFQRNSPVSPCPLAPGFKDKFRDYMAGMVWPAAYYPRMLSAKVVDEPSIGPDNLCGCEHCQATFRKRYGIEYETARKKETPYARWALGDFLGFYVGEVFAAGPPFIKEQNLRLDLVLTYMVHGLGYQHPLSCQQDCVEWTKHVQLADFDVYPYAHPNPSRIRMVAAAFCMSAIEDIARARNIPWGFYVELGDPDWPFVKNPKQASAECAFTAVAHGARYLNTFMHQLVGDGIGPERWDETGRALRTIGRCGPLLVNMPALPAKLAVYFPDAHEFIEDGYDTPEYTLSMLKGTFGTTDIRREELIIERGTVGCPVMLMLCTKWLHEDAVPILQHWLKTGGVLITDGLPEKTHREKKIDWPIGPAALKHNSQFAWTEASFGKGRVIILETNIEKRFHDLCQAKTLEPATLRSLRYAFRDLIETFVKADLVTRYTEQGDSVDIIEPGLRGNGSGIFLTVVNHRPQRETVETILRRDDIHCLVDMETMKPVPFTRTPEGIRIELDVPSRWARLLAGYPRKPSGLELKLAKTVLKPGEPLVYSVQSRDCAGVLLDVSVRNSRGEIVTRLGGSRAPADGKAEFSIPLPINSALGMYTIHAEVPQFGLTTEAQFEVRQ